MSALVLIASACNPSPPTGSGAVASPTASLQFDYTLTMTPPGQAPFRSIYTTTLVERKPGLVRAGFNIPVGTPSASARSAGSRADVAFKTRATYYRVGDKILVRNEIEYSGVPGVDPAAPAAIDVLRASSTVALAPGESTQVAAWEEPNSHRHYRLELKATP